MSEDFVPKLVASVLPEARELLAEHAKVVLAELERAEASLAACAAGTVGTVEVASFASAITQVVAPAIVAVREQAPAKVNLDLRVTGRRPDGYHELDSVVAFTAWADELTFAPARGLSLELAGPFAPALAEPCENLVLRAARRLAEQAGCPARARITLDKRIPVARELLTRLGVLPSS